MSIRNIHIIRGVAALLVVLYHSKFVLWCGGKEYVDKVGLNSVIDYILFCIDMLSSCGKQAVITFFLLSSFVITHSFRKQQSLLLFVKIRLVRIYLPFLFSIALSILILVFCVTYLLNPDCSNAREYTIRLFSAFNNLNLVTIFKTIIFTPGKEFAGFNFAYWSLFHEAIFYLLFPLYFKLNNTLLFIGSIFILILSFVLKSEILYFQTFFLLGILIYNYIYLKEYSIKVSTKIIISLTIVFFISINLSDKFNLSYLADALTVLLFIIVLYFLLTTKIKLPSILFKIADKSYSLYLFHLPILMLYFSILSYFTQKCVFYSRIPYFTGFLVAVILNIPLYYLSEHQSLKIINTLKNNDKYQL